MMLLQQDIGFDKNFDVGDAFFYSCNDNFILFDTLDADNPKMPDKSLFYNSSFYHTFFVVSGTIKALIDGVEIVVKEKEYLVIMPCTRVQFISTQAVFFAFIMRAHIVLKLYNEFNIPFEKRRELFSIYHYTFDDVLMNECLSIYRQMKNEAKRKDYMLKELAFREYASIFLLNIISKLEEFNEIHYYPMNKRRSAFIKFQELLHFNYMENRNVLFYAEQLGITPKYLSYITTYYTGFPASVVIDNYVVFRIKVMLYEGELNIKKISEMFNFQSQSFFGRYFKRITGMSPREFVVKFNKRLYRVEEQEDNNGK